MQSNKTIQILQDAQTRHYGVIAAIVYNLENIIGFVKAAEQRKSPLILLMFPWAITFSDGLLVHAAAQAARTASVPIAVHLDHCQEEEMVRRAALLPFDSIMVDMSHYEMEENLAKTASLAKLCHEHGKAVEAEPGRIEGAEDGLADTEDLSGLFTTPEEAQRFINAGVDMLAPSFGNVHGEYGPRGINLDFERLASIREKTTQHGIFLVLHGVNNFPKELFHRLVEGGITKINVNRDTLEDYYKHLEQNAGNMTFTKLLEGGVEVLTKSMAALMDDVWSSGKA